MTYLFKKRVFGTLVFISIYLLVLGTFSAYSKLGGAGKVLVSGAPIHGTNGILFDSNDRLYIASFMGKEILVMDGNSGRVLDRIGPIDQTISPELSVPDDIDFGPDGSLYWTSVGTGYVGRLLPDGSHRRQFVGLGVNPITFSSDGSRLFVAMWILGEGLYELDPELEEDPRLIATNGPAGPLGMLNGMDWGPDGLLYAPAPLEGFVAKIDVDTGDYEIAADGFAYPAAVKFDSLGRLHVVDSSVGIVWRVNNLDGGDKEVIAELPLGLDNLAFDSRDRLFVSNYQDGYIHQVLPSGETRIVSEGGLIGPGGVAALPCNDGGESVFVTDFWTLREFDGLTGRLRSVERELPPPATVSASGEYLVLSSWFANLVLVWDPETQGMMNGGEFAVPLNAIPFKEGVAVAELGTGSVVYAWGPGFAYREPLIAGPLPELPPQVPFIPTGLAAAGDMLWVCDWVTGSVWRIMYGDPTPIPVAQGLSFPEGLAIDLDGSLLVVESGVGRLSRIDPATGLVSTVVEGLEIGLTMEGVPPTVIFSGVAVGSSGYIYVTGDVANVLYRLKPSD